MRKSKAKSKYIQFGIGRIYMHSNYSLDPHVKVQDHLVERNCKGFGHAGSFTRALKTTSNRKTIDYLDAYICLQKYSLDRYVKVQDHLVERN